MLSHKKESMPVSPGVCTPSNTLPIFVFLRLLGNVHDELDVVRSQGWELYRPRPQSLAHITMSMIAVSAEIYLYAVIRSTHPLSIHSAIRISLYFFPRIGGSAINTSTQVF